MQGPTMQGRRKGAAQQGRDKGGEAGAEGGAADAGDSQRRPIRRRAIGTGERMAAGVAAGVEEGAQEAGWHGRR